jgi:ubiquinone/menaquinone biosynthesis C-methylase UbiE
MPFEIDPERLEPAALFELVDFNEAHVLEIGCGDGRLTRRYVSKARIAIGIETSYDQLRAALAACPGHLVTRLRLVQATALTLPFQDQTVDIVLFAWSF